MSETIKTAIERITKWRKTFKTCYGKEPHSVDISPKILDALVASYESSETLRAEVERLRERVKALELSERSARMQFDRKDFHST